MAASTFGISTLTFGNPTLTGYVIQSYTKSETSANIIEVLDETGNRVCARYDDDTTEITIEAVFAGATLPSAGASFAYDGVTYECLSVETKGENKSAKKVTLKGKKSAGISVS